MVGKGAQEHLKHNFIYVCFFQFCQSSRQQNVKVNTLNNCNTDIHGVPDPYSKTPIGAQRVVLNFQRALLPNTNSIRISFLPGNPYPTLAPYLCRIPSLLRL